MPEVQAVEIADGQHAGRGRLRRNGSEKLHCRYGK
jgi:hypothetical protein